MIKLDEVEPKATAETLIQQMENVQETIIQEQIIGQARAEEQQASEQADVFRRQLGDKFCTSMVSSFIFPNLNPAWKSWRFLNHCYK